MVTTLVYSQFLTGGSLIEYKVAEGTDMNKLEVLKSRLRAMGVRLSREIISPALSWVLAD